MKKTIWMLAMSLVLLITFGINVQAQPKEVIESITTTYYGTYKVAPVGANRGVMSYEAIGLVLSDTGQGLFHQGTARILGSLTIDDKGKWDDERGSGVYSLMNGDKIFVSVKAAGEVAKQGVSGITKGTVTILGGTGKCSGIEGTFEFTRYTVPKPAIEGIIQSYVKANIKYKLP